MSRRRWKTGGAVRLPCGSVNVHGGGGNQELSAEDGGSRPAAPTASGPERTPNEAQPPSLEH